MTLRYPRSELAILRDLVLVQDKLIAAYAAGHTADYMEATVVRWGRLCAELEGRESEDRWGRICKGPKAAIE